eukprot:TRINITY_DN3432_c0_g1_i2.p1 TRINITY_DN3432_c0_g1~~TRINITY_DN3432_c0_g1_i2.p1  ORF type:complete len:330 (-),score=55.43 TRINITY_DN3432_c0_g1_i2:521-1510(-)
MSDYVHHDLSEDVSLKKPFTAIRRLFAIRHPLAKPNDLRAPQKIAIGVSVFQATFLLTFNIVLLVLDRERCATPPCRSETNLFYSISLFIMTAFTVYYAISANQSVNHYEHFAYLINSFLVTIYAIFQISASQNPEFITLVSVWGCCFIAALFASYYGIKSIELQRFHISLEGNEPRNVWNIRQAFYTVIKFDLMIGLILVSMSGVYFFDKYDAEFILTVFAFIVSFIWVTLGIIAVSSYGNVLLIFYYAIGLLEPAYIVYKMFSMTEEEDFPYSLFVTAGTFGLIVRLSLLVATFKVRSMWIRYQELEKRKEENVPLPPGGNVASNLL